MKKMLLSIALTLLGSISVNAKTIIVSMTNGGTDGYKDITESHNKTADYHQLHCDGGGTSVCQWTTRPWTQPINDDLDICRTLVNEQVQMGVYNGTRTVNNSVVTWGATSVNDITFTFQNNED